MQTMLSITWITTYQYFRMKSERGHITYVQYVIEYYIEKQLYYLKKRNKAYTIFSLIISHLMTTDTFVEHVIQKFQEDKYHVKLCVIN